MSTAKKVIELIRVSTEAQAGDKKGGIDAQKAANQQTAKQYGLEIVKTVKLVDVSGAEVLWNEEFRQLLKDIADPEVYGVVTCEFSRLMRPENPGDGVILQRFMDTDTRLCLPTGPIDFNDDMGGFMGGVLAQFSGLHRKIIRNNTMRGKEALRKKGRWAVSWKCLPYGVAYDRETCQFSYKQPEAQKLKKVFKRCLAGDLNYAEHAKSLNVAGSSVRHILTNPIYKGYLFLSQRRDPTEKRISKKGKSYKSEIAREQDKVINKKVMPGLISEKDFDRVYAKIAVKTELNTKKITNAVHFAYTGVLFCAKCGARMYTQLKNQREEKRKDGVLSIPARYFYVCSKRLRGGKDACDAPYCRREQLEAALDWQVARKLSSPKWLEQTHKAYRKQLEAGFSEKDRARTQEHLDKLLAKRKRIEDVYFDGKFEKSGLDERLSQVDREIQEARDTLAELTQKMPPWDPKVVAELAEPLHKWRELDREDKQKLLKSLPFTFQVLNDEVKMMFMGYETPPNMAQNNVLTTKTHS